jgi:MoaA/NifB/PqqE/SkfB family radical SAM enzyme
MTSLKRLHGSVSSRLGSHRLVQRVLARVRRDRYERQVAAFLRDGSGRAGRLPSGVVYETTMRCNLKCEFCYVGELLNIEGQWRQELTLEALRRAFPDREGLEVSLTGGEVFVRKDILDVLELFRAKGYRCGYLTTNGTVIDEKRAAALAALAVAGFLTHVTVSIDGPEDLHDRARGVAGTFARAAAGLGRLQAAARDRGAPLRLSINATVARETLGALDRLADVAAHLGVDAIGLNHLMYATPDEVAQTVKLTGAGSPAAIATFVTADPGVRAPEVGEKVAALERACRERNIRFDYRPRVGPRLIDPYYTPGAPLAGRCLYPFLRARVGYSGKVFFCPFIRVEVGDLTRSTLADVWNAPRYVDLRRRLLERRLFPVCRRCCKVELSPDPVPVPVPAPGGRRVIPLALVAGAAPGRDGTRTRGTGC